MSEKTPTTKKASYSQKYREKVKNDPEKYQAMLQKQRDRYMERKQKGEAKWNVGTKAAQKQMEEYKEHKRYTFFYKIIL